jgi:fucose permease
MTKKIDKKKSFDSFDDVFENDVQDTNDQYTARYRILKSILMILAWISFGINMELTGSAFEDLKILLNVNYQNIAFTLVVRSIGYILMTLTIGLFMDKILNYSDLLMAGAKLLIIIRKLFIYTFLSDDHC